MPSAVAAPGPRSSLAGLLIYRPGRDPLDFFSGLARTYGDIVGFRMNGEQMFLVSDPALIRDVLVTHNKNFHKGRGLERAKRVLGEGLLTSEGAADRKSTRLNSSHHRLSRMPSSA